MAWTKLFIKTSYCFVMTSSHAFQEQISLCWNPLLSRHWPKRKITEQEWIIFVPTLESLEGLLLSLMPISTKRMNCLQSSFEFFSALRTSASVAATEKRKKDQKENSQSIFCFSPSQRMHQDTTERITNWSWKYLWNKSSWLVLPLWNLDSCLLLYFSNGHFLN